MITDRLDLDNASQITASTDTGTGGNISLNTAVDAPNANTRSSFARANRPRSSRQSVHQTNRAVNAEASDVRVELRRDSAIATEATGSGTAGSIRLNLAELRLENSAITASARSGIGGQTSIQAEQIELLNESAIESQAETGTAGSIDLDIDELTLEDQSNVSASAEDGFAGNTTIQAEEITLTDGSSISAVTGQSNNRQDGAVINLNNVEFLFLEDGSSISAKALSDANGGNVNIDASDGFIATLLRGNNDILATADRGNGGFINIRTQGIYGFVENQATSDRFSDLTATSNVGIDGTVLVNDLGIDPVQAAADLPVETASSPLSRGCTPGGGRGSFTNAGQGGIPLGAGDVRGSDRAWEDISPPNQTEIQTITEAQNWTINSEGQVVLLFHQDRKIGALTCQS